jgi:hypothetical protein
VRVRCKSCRIQDEKRRKKDKKRAERRKRGKEERRGERRREEERRGDRRREERREGENGGTTSIIRCSHIPPLQNLERLGP